VLVGRAVVAFRADPIADAVAATLVTRAITAVESRGKNLLVYFDDGRALHIHLRMLGRLGIERPRSAIYRPRVTPHQLRLEVPGAVVVGDRIPVLRLLRAERLRRAPDLAGLGPDLLAPEIDLGECLRRLRALGAARPVGEALMIQRAVAGIGNVYKSETLFLEGIDPRALLRDLDDAVILSLLRRARALLQANVGRGPRVTRRALRGPRLWVYGRRGLACLRCGSAVAMTRQGAPPGRSTYHCPGCQRSPGASRRDPPPEP